MSRNSVRYIRDHVGYIFVKSPPKWSENHLLYIPMGPDLVQHTIGTPLYHRPTQILPKQIPMQQNLPGELPPKKIIHGDVSTHTPHNFFCFFVPTEKKTCIASPQSACIPIHPHISLYIPKHLFCVQMGGNLQFTSKLPTQNVYMQSSPQKL